MVWQLVLLLYGIIVLLMDWLGIRLVHALDSNVQL